MNKKAKRKISLSKASILYFFYSSCLVKIHTQSTAQSTKKNTDKITHLFTSPTSGNFPQQEDE